jgi:hypothetical protein
VYELRRYTLHPGGPAALADLFDRYFTAGQAEVDIRVVGVFADLDDPSQFVWIRSFPDFASRRPALEAFYTSPIWRAHSTEANATMIDIDNVHLLQPDERFAGQLALADTRPGASASPQFDVIEWPSGSDDVDVDELTAAVEAVRGQVVAVLSTLDVVNDFPALPVRTDKVVVALARFDDDSAADTFQATCGFGVQRLRPAAGSPLR